MNHWTKAHWTWIRQQQFAAEAQQRVLADAVQTVEAATTRIKRLDEDAGLAADSDFCCRQLIPVEPILHRLLDSVII